MKTIETSLNTDEHHYISVVIDSHYTLNKLAGDASTRIYYRAITDHGKSYIVCKDEHLKESKKENYPFLIVQRLLSERLTVPRIYQVSSKLGLIILEDFGDELLESYCASLNTRSIEKIYTQILDGLLLLQKIPNDKTLPFQLEFDIDKLMFEFNFFLEHYVDNYKRISLTTAQLNGLTLEFHKIAKLLYQPEHFVLTHRDFHSRNILIKHNRPHYIDFQDARLGLPQYDLVSLLRDSYLVLPPLVFKNLLEYYYQNAQQQGIFTSDRTLFDYYFDLMGFQRAVKVLGSYGYLTAVKKESRYQSSMLPPISYIHEYCTSRDELKKVYLILQEVNII